VPLTDKEKEIGQGIEQGQGQRLPNSPGLVKGEAFDVRENEKMAMPQKSGITQIIIGGILSLVICWGMISVLGVPKNAYQEDITRLENDFVTARQTDKDLADQIGALNTNAESTYAKKAEIAGLSNLPATVDSKLAGYDAKFANYQTELDAMKATLAELSLIDEEGEAIVSEEDTRWTFKDPSITTTTPYSFLQIDLDYDRIEEEGLYDIELEIYNSSTTVTANLNNAELSLVLQPRDYVPINEDDTYLDSDNYPWLDWDTDFVIKTRENVEVCRRITFYAENADLGDLPPENTMKLDLILELYYK